MSVLAWHQPKGARVPLPDPLIIGLCGHADAGKDTAAEWLVAEHGFESYAFAAPIRNMAESFLNDAGLDWAYLFERDMKEVQLPGFKFSARQLMQRLGTECGRGLQDDLWLRMAELALGLPNAPIHDRIVISDVRFPNEAAWIEAHGGRVVRIHRSVQAVHAHESEAHIDAIVPWARIENTGDKYALFDQLDTLVRSLLEQAA